MPSDFIKSIPLVLKDGIGNLQGIDSSNELWLANEASIGISTTYDSVGNDYNGNLRKLSDSATSIGTLSDTFYNQPIGTHPGTSLTIGTTVYNVYQSDTFCSYDSDNVFVGCDSSGQLYEFNDSSNLRLATRISILLHSNEMRSSFRLGSVAPNADYSLWESNVFTDTKSGASSVVYNLYRRDSYSAISTPTYNPVQIGSISPAEIHETTILENRSSLFNMCIVARQQTGVGDYLILPSSQTPNGIGETGTWVPRGTATDTRNTTEIQQFAGQYTGQYAGFSSADFAGTRPAQYSGFSSADFLGTRPAQYSGFSSINSIGTRPANFAGFVSQFFASGLIVGYSGQTDAYFEGTRTVQYSGTGQFTGTRTTNFLGVASGQFLGPLQYGSGPTNFQGGTPKEPLFYEGVRKYAGTAYYVGTRSVNYEGVRPWQWTGPRNFAGVVTQQFLGQRATQYIGFVTAYYLGTRPAQYSGFAVHEFLGTRPAQYSGFSSANFAGTRPAQYAGFSSADFAGTRPAQYSGQYTAQYSGETLIASPVTIETYTLYCRVDLD